MPFVNRLKNDKPICGLDVLWKKLVGTTALKVRLRHVSRISMNSGIAQLAIIEKL